ncbi:hypothetical protein DL96DRAFT_1616285 [Flagelloscypha sp. PMI_526]|nr:hypothetical protein DL96DRAFT_1616285 [Flagelloscypha sp. PMI_526]
MLFYFALLALLAALSGFASPLSSSGPRTVFQFEDGTFIENIAARSNGDLLLTSVVKPVVFRLDPNSPNPSPSVAFQFPNATGTTGITEVYPDVFAVLTGILNPQTAIGQKGSLCLWTVDFGRNQPAGKKIACVPDSIGLNGATTIKGAPGIVLVSDSRLGGIYRINVRTGEVALVLQDPLLEGGAAGGVGLGINGLRAHGHKLFFANSAKKFFGSIELDSSVASINTITTVPGGSNSSAYDDFAFDKKGNAWIALHPHSLAVVKPSGEQEIVLGADNSTFLADPTSAAFGRGGNGRKETLYVVTGGIGISGGQVVAVDC